MKWRILLALSLTFLTFQEVNASTIHPLEDGAFADEERADETAKVINQNFQELFNTKVSTGNKAQTEPKYFVTDLLNPDLADENAFYIMENADDLWRSKLTIDDIDGERSFFLTDLLDPETIEEKIAIINQIFFDLDSGLEEIQ